MFTPPQAGTCTNSTIPSNAASDANTDPVASTTVAPSAIALADGFRSDSCRARKVKTPSYAGSRSANSKKRADDKLLNRAPPRSTSIW